MKKLLFGLIATIALTLSMNAQQFRPLPDFRKITFPGFNLISSYAGPCISGPGFCFGGFDGGGFDDTFPYIGVLKTADSKLIMGFNEAFLRANEGNIKNLTITVSVDFPVPGEIGQVIGLPGYTIKKGAYKVVKNNGVYYCTF